MSCLVQQVGHSGVTAASGHVGSHKYKVLKYFKNIQQTK